MSKEKKQKNQKRPFSLPQNFDLHPSVDINYIARHFVCNCLIFVPNDERRLLSCQFIALDTQQVVFSTTFNKYDNPESTMQENFEAVMEIALATIQLNQTPIQVIIIENPAGRDVDDTAFALVPQFFEPHPLDLLAAFTQHVYTLKHEGNNGNA